MYRNISVEKCQDLIRYSKPLILDVRTEYEYDGGHIKDALLIPHNELSKRVTELLSHKEKDILVYCHAGLRSVAASHFLLSQGFSSIYNLEAGIIDWEMKGKELV